MVWIYVAVGLGVAGLVPLAVLTARVVVATRGLAREIRLAKSGMEPAHGLLGAAAGTFGRREG